MMKVMDLIFFVWRSIYSNSDDHPSVYASGILSVYQVLTLMFLAELTIFLFDLGLDQTDYIFAAIGISFLANYLRYERGFDDSGVRRYWEELTESKRQLIKKIIVCYLIVLLIMYFVLGQFIYTN